MLDNEPIGRNQKLAAAGLAVFAMMIIVFWFAQLRNNIYGPFNAPSGSSSSQISQNDAIDAVSGLPQSQAQALKSKDTDGDGLSDYDELYIYHTSPYLADTDGDGIPDGVEVKNGTDPNCPQGRTCSSSVLPASPAPVSPAGGPDSGLNNLSGQNGALNNLLNQFNAANPPPQPGAGANGSSNLSSDQIQTLKNLDAASLRQLLLKNGMQKQVLDKISDADLMKSYGEVLQP